MTSDLKEAEVRLISAAAWRDRVAAAADRGERVDVVLRLAHAEWVAARAEVKRLTGAA